jgi:hypothetical protein
MCVYILDLRWWWWYIYTKRTFAYMYKWGERSLAASCNKYVYIFYFFFFFFNVLYFPYARTPRICQDQKNNELVDSREKVNFS